jgi:hypothetical protein
MPTKKSKKGTKKGTKKAAKGTEEGTDAPQSPRGRSRSAKGSRKGSKKGSKKATKKGTKKGSKKGSRKGSRSRSRSPSPESDLWVINPDSGRMVQKGKPTYERLKEEGRLKGLTHYRIPMQAPGSWEKAKPKGKARLKMYEKHPEMFALEPKSEFEKRGERALNQDEKPKYPMATEADPAHVSCYGVKSEMRRLHMERRSRADPKRMAHVQNKLKKALDKNCKA